MKVQIRQGATTREFPLRAVFGQPGYYVADIVPTRDGDYLWTFVGSINGDQVNEKFDAADGKFNKVEPAASLQLPQGLPDPAQQGAALSAAQADAQNARMLAFGGIGVGLLGLLAALAVWFMRPRTAVPAQAPLANASSRASKDLSARRQHGRASSPAAFHGENAPPPFGSGEGARFSRG